MRHRHVALSTIGSVFVGCASAAPPATIPPSAQFGDLSVRRAHYDAYKLTYPQKPKSAQKWRRRDGSYSWEQIEDLAKMYPETEDIYRTHNTRGTVIECTAGFGAGLVIGTVGAWAAHAGEGASLSNDTSLAFLATGGVFLLGALITVVAWPDPADTFAEAYNRELRRELDIDEPAVEKPAASMWRPRHLGNGRFGWVY